MIGSEGWVLACAADALKEEEALRWDHGGRTYVVVRSPEGEYFAMDGFCSHEKVHLADGIVDGDILECPKHFGTFAYKTGEARMPPACVDLQNYEVRVQDDGVFVKV